MSMWSDNRNHFLDDMLVDVLLVLLAQLIGVAPEHCIVFEDAPFGIEAARRAGMRAVALCTSHRAEELAGPQVIASANHYLDLMNSGFLETLYVATS